MLATMDTVPVSKVVSPEELDTIICEAYVLGNDVRRKLIMALAAMDEGRFYLLLGFSSIAHYAEKRLRCGKSQTYEFTRVARALRLLPKIDHRFRVGALGWSDVREIVKVATPEVEDTWIEFAKERSIAQVEAEVRDALKKNRKTPRSDRHGLPRVTTRIGFELEPEENDLVAKALKKAKLEIGASLGDAPVELKDALLYIAKPTASKVGWICLIHVQSGGAELCSGHETPSLEAFGRSDTVRTVCLAFSPNCISFGHEFHLLKRGIPGGRADAL